MAEKDFDWEVLSLRVGGVFTPSAPINSEELFRGRTAQVREVVDAINQPGRHAILFGGRGVGKTSLGKILPKKLISVQPCPILAPFVTCDSSDHYSSIWRKVFLELRYRADQPDAEGEWDRVSDPDTVWTPFEVRRHLEQYADLGILFVVIDEFDKVEDPTSRQLLADTIKLLSDHAVRVTLVIIGVADDATGLIDDHQSIDRCVAQISMPRMTREESDSIITTGLGRIGMSITREAQCEIVGLSKGLPTYTHVLTLHAARSAIDSKRLEVTASDVKNAISLAIAHSEETIRAEYTTATFSPRHTIYPQVLLACAMAITDEYGRFQPTDLIEPMRVITKRAYKTQGFTVHLKAFCEKERGYVLRMGGVEYRRQYFFRNPLMQPYVLMKGLHSKMVNEDDLYLRPENDKPFFRDHLTEPQ